VEIYAKVYPNLKVHDQNYPTPESLKSKIREGNVEFEGDTSKDTPGSNLIKEVLLDDKGSPVYLQAWGGQSTIARALKAIKLQYENSPHWPAIQEEVSKKAIIQAFGDQDGTNASYIKPEWPGIEFRQMSTATWGYGARGAVRPEYAHYLSAACLVCRCRSWTQISWFDLTAMGSAGSMTFAKPKSSTFTVPSRRTLTLAGFRS
jgi:Protein of unknown function (DUF1593)